MLGNNGIEHSHNVFPFRLWPTSMARLSLV